MKPGQRRPAGELRAPMLAGWLFADLLLVLFLAAFTSLSAPAVHHKHPTPTPSPTVTPTPKPRVLEQKPQTFAITDVSPTAVSSGSAAARHAAVAKLLGELRKKIAARGLQGRQAGFVIVLAYGPITDIGQALSTANSVERILKAKESQFSGIAGLGYWQGNAGFKFKVFFFA